ncbi:MAG: hypothetical protein IJY25_03075 [Bacilli bacterium]|nr:hypothetical protein [Bacilli bacterium]
MKMEDFSFFIVLPAITIIFFIWIGWINWKDYKISKEVIKYSEEYTIFNECTEIQGKYYCK